MGRGIMPVFCCSNLLLFYFFLGRFYFLFIRGDPFGASQRPVVTQPSVCVTSTRIRPLGAPNLERHAIVAWSDIRFWSTSTGIGYFGASTCLNLFDVIEGSPPRCIKIRYLFPWFFSWGSFFRRHHRGFAACPKRLPKGHKLHIP